MLGPVTFAWTMLSTHVRYRSSALVDIRWLTHLMISCSALLGAGLSSTMHVTARAAFV